MFMFVLYLKVTKAKTQQKTQWRRLDKTWTFYTNKTGQKTQEQNGLADSISQVQVGSVWKQ